MGLFDSLFGGKAGQNAGNAAAQDPEGLKYLNEQQAIQNNNRFGQAIANYGQGKGTANDVLGQFSGGPGTWAGMMNSLATNPFSGSRFATEQVQNNGILGGLFGKGGQLNQAEKEATDLAGRGYSLKPEDYEAYGQGAGQIARNYDQAESGLAQALAARGLTQSGSANRAFIGSQGNKLEQLGQLQRQIANDRMNMNLQRLNSVRNYATQLGAQGENAINQQFNRQLEGVNQGQQSLMDSIKARQRQQQMVNEQSNQQFNQEQASQKGGLGSMIGGAIGTGIAGGIGGGIGGGLSNAIGGRIGGIFGNSAPVDATGSVNVGRRY